MSVLRRQGHHSDGRKLTGVPVEVPVSAPVEAPAAEKPAETPVLSPDMQAELDRIEALVAAEKAAETLARWRASRPVVPVAADLALSGGHGGLPLFRDLVRGYFVRSEPHHQLKGDGGNWEACWLPSARRPEGEAWHERSAAIYRHRTAPVPEPDYALRRYDGMASDAIASGLAKADAEWAARKTEDAPERPEHEGRHAGRREAWTEVASS